MIIGEAGIGKTALAEALAAEAAVTARRCCARAATRPSARCSCSRSWMRIAPVWHRMTGERRCGSCSARTRRPFAALVPEAAALLGADPALAGQPGHGTSAVVPGGDGVLGRAGGRAARSCSCVDDLQYAGQSTVEFIHYLGRHAAGVPAARGGDRPGRERPRRSAPRWLRWPPGSRSARSAAAAVEQLARQAGQDALAGPHPAAHAGPHAVRGRGAADAGRRVTPACPIRCAARSRRGSGDWPSGRAPAAGARRCSARRSTRSPWAHLLDLRPGRRGGAVRAGAARPGCWSSADVTTSSPTTSSGRSCTPPRPEPTRLAYHRRAADLLTSQPESLARHAAAAGDWLRAARAWLLAAEDAMRRFAATDAIALATQALDGGRAATGTSRSRARALVVRGRAREAAGAHRRGPGRPDAGASAGARAAGDRRLEMLALRELGGDVRRARAACRSPMHVQPRRAGCGSPNLLGDRASEADLLARLAIIAANRLRLDRGARLRPARGRGRPGRR